MTRRTFAVSAGALALAACASRKETSFDYGQAKEHYALKGVVLRLKPADRIAVIKHEKIDGWMEAMTMEFPIPSAAEFTKLKEGMTITAAVEVNDLHYWLINIQPQP